MATSPTDWEKQNKGKAKEALDRARSGQQVKKPERVNSQQVAKTGPGMNGPNPPANAKNAMARETHNKNMAKDREAVEKSRAKQLLDGARKQRAQKQPEHTKGEKER